MGNDAMMEKVLIQGDLSHLNPSERISYYKAVCESIGLNPLTKPFDYINLSGKLTLYVKRDATEQLRKIHGVSIVIANRERIEDVYIVTARATLPNGRTDESLGVVSIGNLKGDALANALMKAETKAKRRVTLSIVGLGWLEETEIETIPNAYTNVVDIETGASIKSELTAHFGENTRAAQPAKTNRPLSPVQVKTFSTSRPKWLITSEPNEKQAKFALTSLSKACEGDDDTRHIVIDYLFGVKSQNDLTAGQCSFIIDWCGAKAENEYTVNPDTIAEIRAIVKSVVSMSDEKAF